MKLLFTGLLNLVYPNLCLICGNTLIQGENLICMTCLQNIPKTNFHLVKNNPVEKRFWGKVPIYRATSFFFFHKGSPFQHLLHELKYKGNKKIGEIMALYAAVDLLEIQDFESVDIIIPVPLHPDKLRKRGYNQSEWIAKGLSTILKKPIDTQQIIRTQKSSSQTRMSVYERYQNTKDVFALNDPCVFKNKHVLLVDDVLTTGSTLEACVRVLLRTENIRISIFTLALA